MLLLAHGIDVGEIVGGAYLMAAPGILVYCGFALWAVWCTGWARKVRTMLAVAWAVGFPLAFMALFVAGMSLGEFPAAVAAVVVCSGVSALTLWMATGSADSARGCAVGGAATTLIWLLLPGRTKDAPIAMTVLTLVWAAPVAVSLLAWGRAVRRKRRSGVACLRCGYDLRGLSGGVCPECGKAKPGC